MKICGVYREQIFSPGKVSEDAAILNAVLNNLNRNGHKTCSISAESMHENFEGFDLILSMAQSDQMLSLLENADKCGIPVVNAVTAVRNCYRKALIGILSQASIPMPAGHIESIDALENAGSSIGSWGYWLKRGDLHALGAGDVAKIESFKELSAALVHFRQQGIEQVLVQDHAEGPCAKFYGVGIEPGSWFRAFLPGSEKEISTPADQLAGIARAAARCVGLEIYGGDAIITSDGTWMLIDLNDWPTFSSCRESAAQAIVNHLEHRFVIKGVCNGI